MDFAEKIVFAVGVFLFCLWNIFKFVDVTVHNYCLMEDAAYIDDKYDKENLKIVLVLKLQTSSLNWRH